MVVMLQIVFLVYNQVWQGQRKIHISTGYKIFSRNCMVKHVSFQKIVLNSQKVSESMISAASFLFFKSRKNLVVCVDI